MADKKEKKLPFDEEIWEVVPEGEVTDWHRLCMEILDTSGHPPMRMKREAQRELKEEFQRKMREWDEEVRMLGSPDDESLRTILHGSLSSSPV